VGAVAPPLAGDYFGPRFGGNWYASAAGLYMGRDEPNHMPTTFITNNNAAQIPLNANTPWEGGFEVKLGYILGSCGARGCGPGADGGGPAGYSGCGPTCDCGVWALEADFWWLAQMNGTSSAMAPAGGSLSTTLNFTDVIYPNPTCVDPFHPNPVDLFNNSCEHVVQREDQFWNLELNLVRLRTVPDCCNGLSIDWLFGVRWFEFDENYSFESAVDGNWSNPLSVGVLQDKLRNSLVGAQFGFNANYCFAPQWKLSLAPKFGIFDNHINQYFAGYRANGDYFGPNPLAPGGLTGSFPVSASTDTISFLSQIDLKLEWQFHPQWNAFIGYRLLYATGIALAENQFPQYICDLPAYSDIKHNGELVLHGAFAGLGFCF
jgi:hypothetical protein